MKKRCAIVQGDIILGTVEELMTPPSADVEDTAGGGDAHHLIAQGPHGVQAEGLVRGEPLHQTGTGESADEEARKAD